MPTITPDDANVSARPKLTVVGGKASRTPRPACPAPSPVDPLEAEAAALPDEFHPEEIDAVVALFRLIRSSRRREFRTGGEAG